MTEIDPLDKPVTRRELIEILKKLNSGVEALPRGYKKGPHDFALTVHEFVLGSFAEKLIQNALEEIEMEPQRGRDPDRYPH